MREHNEQEVLTVREQSTLGIITKVYRQQKNHFDSNDPRESIPDRIVSISKPYMRPIVRGKEVKSRNSPSTPSMRAQDSDIASRCTSGCLVWMRRR